MRTAQCIAVLTLTLVASAVVAMTSKQQRELRGLEAVAQMKRRAADALTKLPTGVVVANATCGRHRRRSGAAKGTSCVTCNDGESCCDGEACCSNGAFCCANTATCCSDTCCDNASELCCPDPVNGGVCCESEQTFCCPPQPQFDHPSRCCPRWYVCCDQGRYGCCDPDTGRPMEEAHEAYGMFLEPTWIGPMVFKAATINLTDFNRTEVQIEGFHTGGESTRMFMFSRSKALFYLLQANFTGPQHSGDPDRAIHLFTINPRTGRATKTAVAGAMDEVTGYHYSNEREVIVMATWWYDGATKIGYKFYHVDPTTAVATQVSSIRNPSATDTYAGWFHEVSADGLTLYRLGYQNVVTSDNFGVGVTNISTANATTRFVSVTNPPWSNNYVSINKLGGNTATTLLGKLSTDANPTFVSLAASANASNYGDLSLYEWQLDASGAARLVASFPDAHTTPQFGPIAEALNAAKSIYTAVVVADDPISDNDDVWTVVGVNLATGQSLQKMLKPVMLAETVSVSGFGIPEGSLFWGFDQP